MRFFASVEQYRNHPKLVGFPVCVGHDPKHGTGRGVVTTASYEARQYGIHSGMPVSRAYHLCPDAVFIRSGFESYLEASDLIMRALKEFADEGRIRRASIDEAYIECTFRVAEYESPVRLAVEIQREVKRRTNLPCSIGIASNMSVAKIATGMRKPEGITMVGQDPGEIMAFLAPLDVERLNGVGKKTAVRLRKAGIQTLGQIQGMSIPDLWPIIGRSSVWLHNRACGIDNRPFISNGSRACGSISNDYTFAEDVDPRNLDCLHNTISDMCDRIGQRLIEKELLFKTVTVKMRYSDYTTMQRSKSIPSASSDKSLLTNTAIDIFDRRRDPERHVRLLGVKVSGLSQTEGQACLTDFFLC